MICKHMSLRLWCWLTKSHYFRQVGNIHAVPDSATVRRAARIAGVAKGEFQI